MCNVEVKQGVRIEDWDIVHCPIHPDEAFLVGAVFNHPSIPDGHRVLSSVIIEFSDNRVITRNNLYILGRHLPNAVHTLNTSIQHFIKGNRCIR